LVQNIEKNIEIKIYINKNYILYYNFNAKKGTPTTTTSGSSGCSIALFKQILNVLPGLGYANFKQTPN
jgi:hypothetical protein